MQPGTGIILRPIVENAITHGIEQSTGKGTIHISADRSNGRLTIKIEDNGPGLTLNDDGTIDHGIGLTNVHERLVTLYGESGRLSLDNRPEGGLCVTVTLPVEESS